MTTTPSADQLIQVKIAHLQMVQGVIGRIAGDGQTLKNLAITTAAAIIALGSAGIGGVSPWLAVIGALPIMVFWVLNAHTLHIERAYRNLYDKVRRDEVVEAFAMDYRMHRNAVDSRLKLAFTPSICLPYASVIVILLIIAATGGGTGAKVSSSEAASNVVQQAD